MTTESTDHASFVHDIAPYLLGALDHDEARAFEAHLRTCTQCSDDLVRTSPLADHLARLGDSDFAPPPPPPDTLLARLFREVDHERRAAARRSRFALAAAASVAALLAAIVTSVVVARSHHEPARALALAPVIAGRVPVHASVRLTPQGTATSIDLTCSYEATARYGERAYYLVVTDRGGAHATVSTWTIDSGSSIELHAQSPWERKDMSRIALTTPDGTEILALNL